MENENQSRRDFLKKSSALGIAGLGIASMASGLDRIAAMENENFPVGTAFTLPPLPYGFDALEPHIDKMTMEIHYTKHHQAYVNNLNKAFEEGKYGDSLDGVMKSVSKYPMAVRNNGGGHWNHSFFWKIMAPAKSDNNLPTGKIAEAINGAFGNFDDFKKQFNDAAAKRFGSGWAWLVKTSDGRLTIGSTPNQDNPLMDVSDLKGTPLMGVDVWEHAYYLKYQNKRADYVTAWWNVLNWDAVAKNLL
jgi:Fe-Mn family superoxide dismutase